MWRFRARSSVSQFPLIAAAGRALGRHPRFADTPEPVRRSRPADGV